MIKLIELFAGYGGASFSLKEAKIDHELIGYSEIDKFAIQTFDQNHESRLGNLGSIVDIDFTKFKGDVNLITGGSPCQDFSYAGKRGGTHNEDGSLTRSGLVWEFIRALVQAQPEHFVWENVGGTMTALNQDGNLVIDDIKKALSETGYNVKFKILYGTEHGGVPQRRPRIVGVGTRIDIKEGFEFPTPLEKLTFTLQDVVEENVDPKYFLTEEQADCLILRVHSKKGEPLMNWQDYRQHLLSKAAKKAEVSHTDTILFSAWSNYADVTLSPTMTTSCGGSLGISARVFILPDGRWRRMTPTEAFKFMGISHFNFKGLSDTQLYKQAGNGWIVPVFTRVFQNLYNIKQ